MSDLFAISTADVKTGPEIKGLFQQNTGKCHKVPKWTGVDGEFHKWIPIAYSTRVFSETCAVSSDYENYLPPKTAASGARRPPQRPPLIVKPEWLGWSRMQWNVYFASCFNQSKTVAASRAVRRLSTSRTMKFSIAGSSSACFSVQTLRNYD